MNEAEIWLKKAEEDFDTAEFNKEHKKFSYAAFLFQQAVEKGFKAVLIKKKKGLPKSHDCFVLAKTSGASENIVHLADSISPYYFRTRYPDALLVNISKEDIERVSKAAKEVLLWIKKNF